jgi:OHCU decarboxylase
MTAGRLYRTLDALTSASDRALSGLPCPDVEEALAAHPRIGDPNARTGEAARGREGEGDREAAWSRQEQAATATMDRSTADELVAGNMAYEERFGHVFLIRGRGAVHPGDARPAAGTS